MQMLSLHLRRDVPVCIHEAGRTAVRVRLQTRCGLHLRNPRQELKSETSAAVCFPDGAARAREAGRDYRGDVLWNILSAPDWR